MRCRERRGGGEKYEGRKSDKWIVARGERGSVVSPLIL